MLENGRTLNGRYKIQSLLGSGGMASVYVAKDLILDRLVAVKVMRFDSHTNEDAMRRFRREALSATQLTHPNIVEVYDVVQEQGLNVIVMEYVDGMDLKAYIAQKGPLHPVEAVRVMMQIVSAIAAAHQNRIIHRDIKPQNILINRQGNVKITDFGIAIALSETSLTQTNTLLGSVHYLSPEQARGGMATVRTDIYALGIVLYELLTGRVPFDGESAVSVALKHFQEPLPPIVANPATIPQSLENIILKATAKEPLDRYETCEAMYQDLSTCLNSNRFNEPRFQLRSFIEQTRVLTPIRPSTPRNVPSTSQEGSVGDMPPTSKAPAGAATSRKKWGLLIFALLSVTVVGLLVWFFKTTPKEVHIPDVTNLTEAEAKIKLADAKLNVADVLTLQSDTVEPGHVIETNPKAGSTVKEKSKVILKVSDGKALVTMKDYQNQSYEAARDELKKLGFIVEKVEETSQTVAVGKIISQSIPPKQKVSAKDTVVTLTVSQGVPTIKMANLQGYSRKDAMEYATANNLSLKIVEEESELPVDTVIRQSIPEGSDLQKGAELTLVLSKGKSDYTVTKQVTIPYDKKTASSSGVNQVEIYIQDAYTNSDNSYQTLQIKETTLVTLTFTLNQKQPQGQYKIVRDGQVIATGTAQ